MRRSDAAAGSGSSRRSRGTCSATHAPSRPGRSSIAAPPPWDARRYALGGFVPTPKTFTLLGKSLGHPVPERPHFELGDLDFL